MAGHKAASPRRPKVLVLLCVSPFRMPPSRTLVAALSLALLAPALVPTAAATHCPSLPSDQEVQCWQDEASALGGWAVWLAVGLAAGAAGLVFGATEWVTSPVICAATEQPPAKWLDECEIILPHRA